MTDEWDDTLLCCCGGEQYVGLLLGKASLLCYNLTNKVIIESNTTLIITLNNLQQHVSALKSHIQAECKGERECIYIYIYIYIYINKTMPQNGRDLVYVKF